MAVKRVGVIGAGSWGTALTRPLTEAGNRITLWAHRRERIKDIRRYHENRVYLPGFILSEAVEAVDDMALAVQNATVVLMVVPSHVFREVFRQVVPFLKKDALIVSASKGIENDTLLTMTRIMEEVLESDAPTLAGSVRPAVLSGPSFAREVADGLPTAVTMAAPDLELAGFLQEIFSTERFRVYTATDMIGLELGGALKNIVAIAAGICDGLGYGTNTRAALITRGLAEISRLGVKMGAQPLTFSGLGGLGDLVLTCTGDLSRNRQVGLKLGRGKKLTGILSEMEMVAEGVKTTASAWNLASKMEVDMPILEQVYQVLYLDKPCKEAVQDLMSRNLKEEISL